MTALARELPETDYWWERPDLGYRDGRLLFAGHDVATVAEEAGKPVFLQSPARVLAKLDRLAGAMATSGCENKIYYAMKANRFAPLLQAMARSGKCGVDICSPDELDLAMECGFAPGDISFTGTAVANRDLERLLVHRELIINCDSVGMIRRIGERAPGRTIGIRVNPGLGVGYGDDEKLTYSGTRTTKFGIYREQWRDALETARRFGLRIASLHFHVGCGYLNGQLDEWGRAVAAASDFIADLPDIETVNVGGGLGLPHREGENELDLMQWATILKRTFAGRDLVIASEPGDFLVKDAGMLVLSVTDVEVKRDTRFVFVDGGFNLAPEPAFYSLPCEPAPCVLHNADTSRLEPVTIAGNINEALDCWAHDIPMPELREGDFLALLNAGGYGSAMASNHCMRGDFAEIAI